MPGFFGQNSRRLVRSDWRGPSGAKRLSEELHAMFGTEQEMQTDGAITFIQRGDTPAIRVVNENGDEIFNSNNPTTVINNNTTTVEGGGNDPPSPADPVPTSGVAYGVISGGGPSLYDVTLYPEGPFRASSGTIQVQQMFFNNDESAQPGMPVVVYFNEYFVGDDIARDYWMLYPTWMPPPPTPP